jgi:hypothetical protein
LDFEYEKMFAVFFTGSVSDGGDDLVFNGSGPSVLVT